MKKCIFCDGAPNNKRLTQTAYWVAVFDGYPVTGGHVLLIPDIHFTSLFEVPGWYLDNLSSLIFEVGVILQDQFVDIHGFTFGVNDGEVAGQTQEHFHMHMIPRRRGDVADPRGGVRNIFPNAPRPWESS